MDYYPVYLNLQDKKTIVIGGGKVAERKVKGLLEAKADITVISPHLTEKLQDYLQHGKIIWKNKTFTVEDMKDAFLIITAANDPQVSLAVKKAAAPNQLINLADDPEESSFILPSVYKQGKLSIAISTSGASPILAKKIKQKLSSQFGPEYKEYVDFLHECRKWILKEIQDPKLKQALLSAITEEDFAASTNREKDFQDLLDRVLYS